MSDTCFRPRGAALALLLFIFPATGIAQSSKVLVSTVPQDGTPPHIHAVALTGEDLGIFAAGGLNGALDLALDAAGNLYAANVGDGTIHGFSATGADLGVFATAREPIGLTFDRAGDLFVSDIFDNSIREFSPTGGDLGVFTSLLGFGCPTDLAFERAGDLLVADPCLNVIRKFSPTGASLGIFVSAGLSAPLGIALDSAANVYVSNTAGAFQDTIRKFSATGEDLGVFASTGLAFAARLAIDPAGNVLAANMRQLPGANGYSIRKFSPAGEDLGDLIMMPMIPLALVVTHPTFAGTPGRANCHGKSVSALTRQLGSMSAAAAALKFQTVAELQQAIRDFCRGR